MKTVRLFFLFAITTFLSLSMLRAQTVVDVIVSSEDHDTLEAAVIAAGLDGTLSGNGPFTVFAPTDDAFAALPDGTIEALLSDPSGDLTKILLYHVAGANARSTDLSDGQMVTTLKGSDVSVTINQDGVFINDARVTVADIEADNGVVHVIDAVMLPEFDIVTADSPEFGTYLTDANGSTLYLFSKDANDTSNCIDNCLANWPAFYAANIYVPAGLDAADFGEITRGDGQKQNTYKGWPLYYFANDDQAGEINGDGVIGKWFVAKPDYSIMLIDNQLTGSDGTNYKEDYTEGDTVIQYFTDDKGVTLYTWINDSSLINKFTNSDFSNNSTWPIYEADTIIVPSILESENFSIIEIHGRNQMTYNGWPLYQFGSDGMMKGSTKGVSVPSPGVWPVAVQDIAAAPAEPFTVVDVVVNSEDHETLEAAVIAAGLVETLSAEGPFTVFAPTDAAFDALPEGTLDALLEDPSGELTGILTYHVVGSKAMSTDLSDGQMIATLNGKEITVTINNDGVFINDAQVTVADIEADNGVVHVIDAVLLPPSPTSVDDLKQDIRFDIYPNPAREFVTIRMSENEFTGAVLRIADITGAVKTEMNINQSEIRINTEDYQPGIYFISVSTDRSSEMHKLIIQ